MAHFGRADFIAELHKAGYPGVTHSILAYAQRLGELEKPELNGSGNFVYGKSHLRDAKRYFKTRQKRKTTTRPFTDVTKPPKPTCTCPGVTNASVS